MVLAIDAYDAEIAHGHPAGAISAGHALAFLRTAATAVTRVGADASGSPVMAFDAVTGRQALKSVPLHDAGCAAPFAGADNVYCLDTVKYLSGGHDLAHLGL